METYRPRSSYIWGWIAVALGVAVAIAQLATTGWADAHVGLGLALALIGSGLAVFLRPSLQVGADAVTVRNITQTVTVPYARLAAIESQWSLELVGDDGRKLGVMAAPARSRRDRRRPDHASTPPLVGVIQTRWDAWRVSGERADGEGPAFTRRFDPVGVMWVVLAVGGAAGAFFL